MTILPEEEVNPIGFEDLESVFKYKDYSMDPVDDAPFTSVQLADHPVDPALAN